ncbi:MAG: hypothetical protein R6W88_15935 [Desulfobacterales bacterium]
MLNLTGNQRYAVDERTVKVVTIDGTEINGLVNKIGHERTSDMFTKDDSPFIIVYKATSNGHENLVFALNKNQIIRVELADV